MNRLRISSLIALLIGVCMAIVGFQLSQSVYGCVPPVNATCTLATPASVAYGWLLLTLGAIVVLVSFAILAYSFVRPFRG